MKKTQSMVLQEEIELLHLRQARQFVLLREQFYVTYESLKPINLIKHTFKEVVGNPGIRQVLLSNAIGLTTGYLTKAIVVGSSVGPVRKLLGTLLQFAVSTLVQKPESIKSLGKTIADKVFRRAVNDLRPVNNENFNGNKNL
jgi:hypothetical protein